MDPLSNVLSLLKPRNYLSAGFEAGGDWSIQFPHQGDGIKCNAVARGQCWLAVEGVPEPVLLNTGDSFLLPSGRSFRLASALDLVPEDGSTFSSPCEPGVLAYNGGTDLLLVSSRFELEGSNANLLLRALPPIVHIKPGSRHHALHWPVDRLMEELRAPHPGSYLVMQHLAQLMLLEALRIYLANGPNGGVGWLFAMADKSISAAISAIHDEPGRRWSLRELAAAAGMSRSAFASRFKETMGISPMEYLAQWRMMLAGERLTNSKDPVSVIAPSLGYESDTAFSMAFKKIMGNSPRQYGRQKDAASV